MALSFRDATDLLGLPLDEIAREAGRGYSTIQAYRQGTLQPTADAWKAVARLARERGEALRAAARELAAIAREAERAERGRS